MLNRINKTHFIIGGGLTYVAAVGVGYLYANSSKDNANDTSINTDIKLSDDLRNQTYSSLASKYDSAIGTDEVFMGLTLIRWWVIRKAVGDILEVGTYIEYY